MASAVTTKTSTMYALDGDEAPHWRVEHATSGMATCNQAQCKGNGSKIEKGELRVGTHTWHTLENKRYWAWRHWRCATPQQIRGLKSISDSELTKVPGYERISEESREQLKLALEEGKVTDKNFKDIRPDLAKGGGYTGEIQDAVGYKIEVTPSARARCRAAACTEQGTKIAKGELRLGILRLFDGEHASYVYKHWKCISKYDLSAIEEHAQQDTFDGMDSLPKDYESVVLESLEKGEVIVPPKLDVPAPAKKSRAKKKVTDTDEDTDTEEVTSKKKVRKPKKKKADVYKEIGTGEMATEDASRKVKMEDTDQDSGNKEAVAEENSPPTEDADHATTARQVAIQEKLPKRKINNAKDGRPSYEEADEEPSVQDQTSKKRKIAKSGYILPATSQAMEGRTEAASINQGDTVGGFRELPLRRSARQAARADGTPNGHAEEVGSKQPKRGRKKQAGGVDVNVADEMAEATPKNQNHKAGAANTVSKKTRRGGGRKTAAQKRRDQKVAAPAATKAGGTTDENVSMANIAELREFMQANAVTTRVQRY